MNPYMSSRFCMISYVLNRAKMVPRGPSSGESTVRMRKKSHSQDRKMRIWASGSRLQRSAFSAIQASCTKGMRISSTHERAHLRRPPAKRTVRELVLRICSSITKSMLILSARKRAILRRRLVLQRNTPSANFSSATKNLIRRLT